MKKAECMYIKCNRACTYIYGSVPVWLATKCSREILAIYLMYVSSICHQCSVPQSRIMFLIYKKARFVQITCTMSRRSNLCIIYIIANKESEVISAFSDNVPMYPQRGT